VDQHDRSVRLVPVYVFYHLLIRFDVPRVDMIPSCSRLSPRRSLHATIGYCRFFLGRRSEDDARQISRGNALMGPKG